MLEKSPVILEKNEVEIEYKWLINAFRNKYKFILVVAIIMSILLTGIMFLVDSKNAEAMNAQLNVNAENILLTEEEHVLVDKFIRMHDKVLYLEEYCETAPVMKLDYNNVCCATVQYFVNGNVSYVNNITNALTYYISMGLYANELAEMLDVSESRQVLDLISVKNFNNIVCVEIYYTSEEECKLIVDKLTEILNKYSEELSTSIGEHDLVLLGASYENVYSEDIYVKQNNLINQLESLKVERKTLITQLTNNQKYFLLQEGDYDKLIIVDKPISIETSIDFKYTLVGAVAGAMLAMGIIFIIVLLDGKIHSENEMKKRFGINKWGTISKEFSDSNEYDVSIVQRLSAHLNNKNVKEILVVGTDVLNVEKISNELVRNDIKVVTADLNEIETKDVLTKNKDVFVVVGVGQDKVKSFYVLDEICNCLDIELHGYVAIQS